MGNLAAIATEGPAARAGEVELTVVLPCLNEAETVGACVGKAMRWLHEAGVDGEVVVADNGSTDGSQELAEAAGARVVSVRRKGYGNALMSGIRAARGTYVIMADADDSYDLENLGPFLARLRDGDDLVMGNRFAGGIEHGAMPWLHRRVGNPVLSGIGRLFFRTPVRDFHCGIRGFRKDAILGLGLRAGGMEFASEMVVKASLAKLKIHEVPTTLRPDGRSRAPHLRSFRDGWRHLRFLLLFCPRWVFVVPRADRAGPRAGRHDRAHLRSRRRARHRGVALFRGAHDHRLPGAVVRAPHADLRRDARDPARSANTRGGSERVLTLERGLVFGAGLIVFGVIVALLSVLRWRQADFGALNPGTNVRTITPAILGLVMGSQTILGSFSVGVLGIRTSADEPAAEPRRAAPSSVPRGS